MNSVGLGDYAVRIVNRRTGSAFPTRDGLVEIPDSTEYAIELRNNSSRRAGCVVKIDSTNVGSFVVDARDVVVIERPAGSARVFRFDFTGGSHARRAGARSGRFSNGLISCTFTPEKVEWMYDVSMSPRRASMAAASIAPRSPRGPYHEGVTTLGRRSDQTFDHVYFEGDYSQSVTINLRLVGVGHHEEYDPVYPLVREDYPRPVFLKRETPVPPPVYNGGIYNLPYPQPLLVS